VEWWLTAASDAPPTLPGEGSTDSITTALIAVLGTVLVALITVGLPLLVRQARTSESPPLPDPKLGERVAVIADHDREDRQTLHYVDKRLNRTEHRADVMWKWFTGPDGPRGQNTEDIE
jgi:hypothetical protein